MIENPLTQPDSLTLLPKNMHITCLRALSGKTKSLTLEQDLYNKIRKDKFVTYNCVLTRAASLGVEHLTMHLTPRGNWALSMFLWRSLRTLCVNFVGVHQLEEFADSFTGFSRLKVILCRPPRSEGILEHE